MPALGDKGPWPRAEKVLCQKAWVCPSLGHRMEAPSPCSEEDLGAVVWAGFFEITFGWQKQECAARKPQQASQTTAQNLLPVIVSMLCWLESEKRMQMFVVLAPVAQMAGGDSWQLLRAYCGLMGCPSSGRNTFFPPCESLQVGPPQFLPRGWGDSSDVCPCHLRSAVMKSEWPRGTRPCHCPAPQGQQLGCPRARSGVCPPWHPLADAAALRKVLATVP